MEEVELAAEPAMVAPPRLLDALEMRVEIGLVEERRAVDARQHRAVRVAAPVGAGERGELERLDRLRRLQVRAAAEVDEAVLLVERDLLALGQRLGDLDLVRLALRREARHGVLARRHDALVGVRAALEDRAHLVLDAREIGLAGRLGEVEVVVEAVLDRGADRDLGAGPEVLHGLGHQVRGGVAQHRQGLVVADAQDAQVRVVGERQAEVAQLAVDLDGGGGVGQPRADRARGVEAARAVGEIELVAVGKDRLRHSSECRYENQLACYLAAMPHPDELKARIEAHLPGSQAVVSDFNAGTGDHFEAHVGAPQFKGLPLLQQHKLVYAAVQDWLDDGRIHALSIKTVVTDGEEQ